MQENLDIVATQHLEVHPCTYRVGKANYPV